MRKPNIKQVEDAKASIRKLFSTYQAWLRVDRIRASLPSRFASKIPASRVGYVKAIIRKLQSMGALKVEGNLGDNDGYGWLNVVVAGVALVAIAGAATVWAVMKYAPRIQEEFRLVKQAEHATGLAQRAFLREKQEAKQLGPEAARAHAAARAAETSSLVSAVMPTSYTPPPPPGESADGGWLSRFGLPSWTPVAGIVGGSAVLALYIYSKRR